MKDKWYNIDGIDPHINNQNSNYGLKGDAMRKTLWRMGLGAAVLAAGCVFYLEPLWFLAISVVVALALSVSGYFFLSWAQKRVEEKKSLWPFAQQPESTLCHIVAGKRLRHPRLALAGYKISPQTKGIVPCEREEEMKQGWIEKFFGGMFLVSIWPHVRIRTDSFKWTNPGPDDEPVSKEAKVAFWPIKWDVYGFKANLIDKNGMTFSLEGYVTLKIINAVKPFFANQNWLERTLSMLQGGIQDYFSDHTYDEFRHSAKAQGVILLDALKDVGTGQGDTVKKINDDVGIEVGEIRIKRPVLPPKEQEKLEAVWSAEQDASAALRRAQIEKDRAEVEALTTKIRMEGLANGLQALGAKLRGNNAEALTRIILAQTLGQGGSVASDLIKAAWAIPLIGGLPDFGKPGSGGVKSEGG